MTTLGTVEFTSDDHPVTATLKDDRTWDIRCDDNETQDWVFVVLDEIASRPHGPADGFYGPQQLAEVVRIFGGRIVDQAPIDHEPGRVY